RSVPSLASRAAASRAAACDGRSCRTAPRSRRGRELAEPVPEHGVLAPEDLQSLLRAAEPPGVGGDLQRPLGSGPGIARATPVDQVDRLAQPVAEPLGLLGRFVPRDLEALPLRSG